MSKVEHGANLFELASKYGFNIDEIMDFSSNINPFGASPKALSEISKNPNLVSIFPVLRKPVSFPFLIPPYHGPPPYIAPSPGQ